jgi:hypothetical protein
VRHQVDLLLVEATPQVIGHRERVGDELLKRHRLGRDGGAVGEPGAALFPPGHGEVLVEAGGIAIGQEILRQAAVEEEQHRPGGIRALDEHSLLYAVDIGEDLLCHGWVRQVAAARIKQPHALELATREHGCLVTIGL